MKRNENKFENLIAELDNLTGNAKNGLNDKLFKFVSRLTPLVNVDLLVKNQEGKIGLTWRSDEFYGPGWHIPGGIIRFKEKMQTRIEKVAKVELGFEVSYQSKPIKISQVTAPHRDIRGHFISLLIACEPKKKLHFEMKNYMPSSNNIKNGTLAWFDRCPENLISQHFMYREYFQNIEK